MATSSRRAPLQPRSENAPQSVATASGKKFPEVKGKKGFKVFEDAAKPVTIVRCDIGVQTASSESVTRIDVEVQTDPDVVAEMLSVNYKELAEQAEADKMELEVKLAGALLEISELKLRIEEEAGSLVQTASSGEEKSEVDELISACAELQEENRELKERLEAVVEVLRETNEEKEELSRSLELLKKNN